MLRTLVLLVATLAALTLAVPAPRSHRSSGSSARRFSLKNSFKSSTRGHRGHSNPRLELARVYHKFHWSIDLPFLNETLTITFPELGSHSSNGNNGGSSDASGSGSGSGSGGTYGSGSTDDYGSGSSDGSGSTDDYGSGSSDDYGSSDGSNSESTTVISAQPTTSSAVIQQPTSFQTATSDSFTSEAVKSFLSSNQVAATSSTSFSTRVSATASATATGSTSGDGNDTGEVSALPEENESEYLSLVTIGGQQFNLNFDTGSADLWIFSNALPASSRGDHSAFDPSKSSTFEQYEGAEWDISYGDGSGASGTVGFDVVDVGGAAATKQAIELATAVSEAFVSDENNDGLLGLAFGKINTIQPTQQKTFFENIADDLEEKLFTADLDVDASGTYEFGRLDESKYQGELHSTSIDNSRGFWEFSSNAYSIGGRDTQNSNASPAIADTGTSLMMVDDDIAEAFYSQIQGSSMSAEVGGYVYPCDAEVPSFGVAIGDSGFMAHINGSDVEYAQVGRNICFGGIQGNGGQGLQIYGAVLLKQYFAVFNFGDLTFGLAQKN